jgi:hypothetical protein
MRDDIKEMKGDIKEVRKNTDTIPLVLEEARGIREDIQPGYANNFRQMADGHQGHKRPAGDALKAIDLRVR